MARITNGTSDFGSSGANYGNNAQISVFMRLRLTGNTSNARIFELGGFLRSAGGVAVEEDFNFGNPGLIVRIWDDGGSNAASVTQSPGTGDVSLLITSNTTGPSNQAYLNGSNFFNNTTFTRGTTADRFTVGAQNNGQASDFAAFRIAQLFIWHGVILTSGNATTLAGAVDPRTISNANIVFGYDLISSGAGTPVGTAITWTGTTEDTDLLGGAVAGGGGSSLPIFVHHYRQQGIG